MALDVYSPCPGGTNRKIKFCACGKDMAHELGRVMDAIQGGQRANAVGQINQLLESHGNRACLLALKGTVQLELEDLEGLRETAETFCEAHAENPSALSLLAISHAAAGDTDAAIAAVQQAMSFDTESLHEFTHQAIGLIGQQMLVQRKILAARAHLGLYVAAVEEEGSRAESMLMEMLQSPQIPLIFKIEFACHRATEDSLWRESCDAAVDLVEQGVWGSARDRFAELADEISHEPIIWRNLAIVEGHLGREKEAARAWLEYARSDGVPLDDAVEAAAMAQLLHPPDTEQLEQVIQTYPFTEMDRVMERLLSDRSLEQIRDDLSKMATDDRPAPKAAFWLLDREMPRTAENLQVDQIPNILGELLVYGRETDREPRVDFFCIKRAGFEDAVARVKQVLGEYGGQMEGEETIGEVSAPMDALSWKSRFPEDATAQQRKHLSDEKRREMVLNIWPKIQQGALGGMSPLELVQDPKGQIQVLAAILLMETVPNGEAAVPDYNLLRDKLGLPKTEDLDPEGVKIGEVSPCRLHRLPPEKLSDEQLIEGFARGTWFSISRAARRMGQELIQRTELHKLVDLAAVYGTMAGLTGDLDESLGLMHKAQEVALAAKRSPAPYLMRELELRTIRGELNECQRVFELLKSQHGKEPGVGEALYRWLVNIGAISPDGQPVSRPGPPEPLGEHPLMGDAPAPQSAQPDSGLWTPDQGAAPAEGKDKPGLWIPE